MASNTANRGNKRQKCISVVLSNEEWEKLQAYGKHYGLTRTAAGRKLINEGLLFHQ